MPERVRTRFDDEGNQVQDPIPLPSSATKKSSVVAPQTKKRHHDGSLVTSDRKAQAPPQPAKEYKPSIARKGVSEKEDGNFQEKKGFQRREYGQKSGGPREAQKRLDGGRNILAEKRNALLGVRKALPIWSHQDAIRKGLRGPKDVMLLVGETGSGKSTQVPQFLLNESWCKGCIAITQPRRVAAISLARRVAEEMGTPLGSSSPASKVGYSVRFDTSISPNTKIKYLTEGMLLQELLRDPTLQQYSAVIVDEVHERSVNVDLVLGFLRNIVTSESKIRKGHPLKVVVMSATADTEGLLRYFDEGYRQADILVEGKDEATAENGRNSSELSSSSTKSSAKQSTGKPPAQSSSNAPKVEATTASETSLAKDWEQSSTSVSTCFIEGRQYPVKTIYLPDPTLDFVESALKSVFQIHYKEPLPGDILVFLTGQDTIENLEQLINEYASNMAPELPKILTLPLFAALPQVAQQRIFQPAPPKTRKVILATNIAETSVTVPGVRYVVDSGKVKIKQFRNRLGLDSLLVKPVSQSSAIQRKGRAGREAPGQCYRLYPEKDYLTLEKNTKPEILRCDLSSALLTMKARGIDDVLHFPFLDLPPREALEKALLQLLQLGALEETGAISDIGRIMAKLPLTPTLARVIMEAALPEKDCLVEIIDIIACLSVESIFLNLVTEEKKEQAEEARKEVFRREGDHLTLLATVQAYTGERTDRKSWAEKHFVSHRAMQNVMDIRKQLHAQCKQLKLLPESTSLDASVSSAWSEIRNNAILQSLLRGFAANTARLMPDGSYRTLHGNHTVAIHPSSVLFGKKVEAIVFSEFVFTNKSYARGVSAVRLDWIGKVLAGDA